MVHTRALQATDRGLLPLLACTAMSSEPHFAFLRPRHALYTHRSENFFSRKQRATLACADIVARVAIADDADPFTDLTLGEEHRQMHGMWVDGTWISDDSETSPEERKVAEGRVMGFTVWQRCWPANVTAKQAVKERSGHVWATDTVLKRIDRTLYSFIDCFWSRISPDPSEDPDHIEEFVAGGGAQVAQHIKEIVEELDTTTGYIFCNTVVVDPCFQRKGIGKQMMRWGLDRAEKECTPIILTSTPKGSALYQKLGFETIGVMNVAHGTVSEQTMIYWPSTAIRSCSNII